MALMIKNRPGAKEVVSQYIHVHRAGATLPQSTNYVIFKVVGGRVLVKRLIGTVVTTAFEGTNQVPSVSAVRADAAFSAKVGTAVAIASTVDSSSLEIGGTLNVEGDGTALVKTNAGAIASGTSGEFVVPHGQIYFACGASKTGSMEWDLWYQPLDEGARVEATTSAVAALS